jgi:site-specific DNA recombinase
MTDTTPRKAVIYCRVSSSKQTTRGDGLSSQETRCRQFCDYRGHEVVKVIKDDMSGSVTKRPGMDELLSYLRKTKRHSHVVIIDDISRLARGIEAHIKLRADIGSTGATLESPSIEFGEDSDSKLVENLLACVSQHSRQKNAEQTLNRMQARMQQGYWVFQAVWGYRYAPCPTGGKMLVRNEPLASILQEALEGYARGRFSSQAEVKRFLESHASVPKSKGGVVLNERVNQLLTQPLYAGYISAPNWNIKPRRGHHEPLIDLDTFNAIQERLKGKARAAARADINADFPLRGHVCCASCNEPMTANWSKGSHGSYPYYLCRQKGCESAGKSIARSKVEDAFEALLQKLTPATPIVNLATSAFGDLWNNQVFKAAENKKAIKREMAETDAKVKQFLDRITETDNKSVITAYEARIAELEAKKFISIEQMAKCDAPVKDFDDSFRTALEFLASPWNLWKSDRMEDKQMALKLTFPNRLLFDRNDGFRTPELSLPFKALGDFSVLKREMARPERFERPTLRFVV